MIYRLAMYLENHKGNYFQLFTILFVYLSEKVGNSARIEWSAAPQRAQLWLVLAKTIFILIR